MAAGYGEQSSHIAKLLCNYIIMRKPCQELSSFFFKLYGLGFEAKRAMNHRPNERQFFDGLDDRARSCRRAMRPERAVEF